MNLRRRGIIASIVLVVSLSVVLLVPDFVAAQDLLTVEDTGLNEAGENLGLGQASLTIIIARIIRAMFGLLGIAAVGYMVYGGTIWMTAGGDPSKVDEAKKIMLNAVIGMAIMLMAFAIVSFIISALVGATTGSGSGSGSSGPYPSGFVGGAALGQTIEYVIPEPGAQEVFRNTSILVQFKKHIVPDTVLTGIVEGGDPNSIVGDMNANNILIFKTEQGESTSLVSDAVRGTLSQIETEIGGTTVVRSLLTLSLKDGGLFGSPTENTTYTVRLGGNVQSFNLAGNQVPVFASLSGYDWSFVVGTKVDLDPPRVTSLYPSIDSENNYRNVRVLMQFNKSMMPTTILTGNYITVVDNDAKTAIDGKWTISNLARTAEFRTSVACGESACGDTYYCFEPNISVQLTAKPADVDEDAGAPKAVLPYNGLVSLTGNSFDGNGDGKADGPAVFVTEGDADGAEEIRDTKRWKFGVGETIDIWSPFVEDVQPSMSSASLVQIESPVVARFDEVLLPSSIGQARLDQPSGLEQYYFPFSDNLDANNQVITEPDAAAAKSFVELKHPPFLSSTKETIYSFKPAYTQGILDAQGNCFVPGEGPSHPSVPVGQQSVEGCSYDDGDTSNPYCCDGKKSNNAQACAVKYQGLQPN